MISILYICVHARHLRFNDWRLRDRIDRRLQACRSRIPEISAPARHPRLKNFLRFCEAFASDDSSLPAGAVQEMAGGGPLDLIFSALLIGVAVGASTLQKGHEGRVRNPQLMFISFKQLFIAM
jgi:hypothetical protein